MKKKPFKILSTEISQIINLLNGLNNHLPINFEKLCKKSLTSIKRGNKINFRIFPSEPNSCNEVLLKTKTSLEIKYVRLLGTTNL